MITFFKKLFGRKSTSTLEQEFNLKIEELTKEFENFKLEKKQAFSNNIESFELSEDDLESVKIHVEELLDDKLERVGILDDMAQAYENNGHDFDTYDDEEVKDNISENEEKIDHLQDYVLKVHINYVVSHEEMLKELFKESTDVFYTATPEIIRNHWQHLITEHVSDDDLSQLVRELEEIKASAIETFFVYRHEDTDSMYLFDNLKDMVSHKIKADFEDNNE